VITLSAQDAGTMQLLGERLAGCLGHGIVFLHGELGAGKTTLARGILRGLGYTDKVRSPTYSLVEPYSVGQGMVYHLDLYRLGDPEELEWLGLRDLLAGNSLLLVEWPQRGAGQLPTADLEIRIAPDGDGRSVYLVAGTAHGRQILDCFKPS
jgi:tRNA threonylcarbamoyladenosine biosynthesis protein TsaE